MKYIIIFLFLPLSFSFSQINLKNSLELSGNLQYSFTNNYGPNGNATSFDNYHTLIIQPEIGYYLNKNLELFADLEYSFTLFRWNTLQSSVDSFDERLKEEITSDRTMHRVGFYFGIGYNFPITESAVVFLGTRIGFSSTRMLTSTEGQLIVHSGGTNTTEYVNYSYDSGWQRKEISFPSFILNLKLFPTTDWIVILKSQYTKTGKFEGRNSRTNELLTFGIGIGTLIN
jgi:hypothetical protein